MPELNKPIPFMFKEHRNSFTLKTFMYENAQFNKGDACFICSVVA